LERALEHERLGNHAAAYECYRKAVDITPAIAFRLIKVMEWLVLHVAGLELSLFHSSHQLALFCEMDASQSPLCEEMCTYSAMQIIFPSPQILLTS